MPVVAVCFPGVDGCRPYAAPYVLAERNRLKVCWIDAASNTAQMVKRIAIRDNATMELIDKSVGQNVPSTYFDSAVSPHVISGP
jgi:hypothetical protein